MPETLTSPPVGGDVLFQSGQLLLRRMVAGDLPMLWAVMQREDFAFFWPPPYSPSIEALADRFHLLQLGETPLEIDVIACYRDEPFALLRLSSIDRHHAKAEFSAYVNHRRGSRQVIEAMRIAIGLGFDRLGLSKVNCCICADNTPAIRLARHVGFIEEGRLRSELMLAGRRSDLLRFGMLRAEWQQLPWSVQAIGSRASCSPPSSP